jgi:hypothetical protein
MCCWPATSSSDRGLIRAASGSDGCGLREVAGGVVKRSDTADAGNMTPQSGSRQWIKTAATENQLFSKVRISPNETG